MTDVILVEGLTLTKEGTALVTFLSETVRDALKDPTVTLLNALSGEVKDFYVKTLSGMKIMSAEQWLRDYPGTAQMAWNNYKVIRGITEDHEAVANMTTQQTQIVEQLTAFKETLMAEIGTLKAEIALLKTPKSDADTPDPKV